MLKLTVAKWANAFMISWAHIKEMVANASGQAESFTPDSVLYFKFCSQSLLGMNFSSQYNFFCEN